MTDGAILFNKPLILIYKLDQIFFNYFSNKSLNVESSNVLHKFLGKGFSESFFRGVTRFGEGYFELSLVLIMTIYFLLNRNRYRSLKKYISGILLCVLLNTVLVNVLKIIFGRLRPYASGNSNAFYGIFYLVRNSLLSSSRYYSFPSGHTITIWGTIWILSFYIKNRYLKLALFTLGILVGLSRIYLSYHWFSDVVTSIGLSYAVSRFIYGRIKKMKISAAFPESV